jgi:hypothetical protein
MAEAAESAKLAAAASLDTPIVLALPRRVSMMASLVLDDVQDGTGTPLLLRTNDTAS